MAGNGIVAVHVGAGSHASSSKDQYKKLMRSACKEAINILKNGGNALDAVSHATKILENSPITNAGYGSALTSDGTVECDASIMDGKSYLHGAVGSVSGVQNPILLARKILDAQNSPLPGGLIPPSFLAGPGARNWAVSHDIEVCQEQSLVTEKTKQMHVQCAKYIQKLKDKKVKKRKFDSTEGDSGMKPGLLDTVGAVCVDLDGSVASSVSSGGILLKHSGRIGQAAVYGCGCWAQNGFEDSGMNIAVSTTGCGEHLIKTTFGRLCAHATLRTDPLGVLLSSEIKEKFLQSPFLKGVSSPMAGSLSLRHDPANDVTDLFWLHSTRSMGVAYMKADWSRPQAQFSELPMDRVGQTITVNCKSFAANGEGSESSEGSLGTREDALEAASTSSSSALGKPCSEGEEFPFQE